MKTEPPNAQVRFGNKKHHLQRPASERGCRSQTMGEEEGKLVRDQNLDALKANLGNLGDKKQEFWSRRGTGSSLILRPGTMVSGREKAERGEGTKVRLCQRQGKEPDIIAVLTEPRTHWRNKTCVSTSKTEITEQSHSYLRVHAREMSFHFLNWKTGQW